MFDWTQYLRYAEVKCLEKDIILFRQGETLNGFYYLLEGKVMISVLREDGYERIIDFVFPGSLIGEQLINGGTSFTTAMLMTDSKLYYFSKPQFELLIQNHPEASRHFGYSLIKKLRMLANINTILNATVDVQLAHFLLKLYEKKGDNEIDVTQTSLAKFLGKSRVAIWKVLKEWRNEGVIEIANQKFILKDIEVLREKAKEIAI